MLNLRPYQEEPIKKAIDYFNSDSEEPSLIVLPTAWGKSIMTAFVAANIPQNEKLLVVQPTKELLEQNFKKYLDLCGQDAVAGIYSASFNRKQMERITYATIGSIKEIGAQFKEQGYTKMLIDEAHLYPRKEESMLGQFLKDSGIHQVLGITATPLKLEQFEEKQGERFDKWSELIMLTNPSPSGTFFKKILYCGQIQEMTLLGFWSPLVYERLPFDKSMLNYNSSGSEFSHDSELKAYALNNIRENIYGALNYHKERNHVLVFVTSVEEAKILASESPSSAVVSGDTPSKERREIIDDFRNGKIRVIYNVNIVATGFDYPEIDMIILGFSTASIAKYYQILGRGVRIHPNKKDCLVVDMGGNIDRFGKVEDIFFKKGDKWRMYGSDGKLLTGLPINLIGNVDRMDINRIYSSQMNNKPTMGYYWSFGKYKGINFKDTPLTYRVWVLNNMSRINIEDRDGIIYSIENHVRDTRNDPPVDIMPCGQHAGVSIGLIPKNYLAWFYNSQEWNETNDSLRRGIEFHYGGVPKYFAQKKKSGKTPKK